MLISSLMIFVGIPVLSVIAPPVAPKRKDLDELNDSNAAKIPKISEPRCKPTVSEIFFDFESKTSRKEFIEVRLNCVLKAGNPPKNVLGGYKLLIVRVQPLAVVTYIDLENLKTDLSFKKEYLVIGTSSTDLVDVNLESYPVQSVFQKNTKLLPGSNHGPFVVMIARDSSKQFSQDFGLGLDGQGRPQARVIGEYHRKLLVGKVVDMIILGYTDSTLINFFVSLLPNPNDQNIVVKDWQKALLLFNFGYSFCGKSPLGFSGSEFQLSLPTPGKSNQCVEDDIMPSRANEISSPDQLNLDNKPLIQFGSDIYKSYNDRHSNGDLIKDCSRFLPARETLLEKSQFQWIDLVKVDSKCQFSCFFCKSYFNLGFRPDIRYRQDLTTNKGYFSTDIYQNSRMIKAHGDNLVHKEAIMFGQKIILSNSQTNFDQVVLEFEQKERQLFNATMNVVFMVYVEAYTGLSFKKHETLMQALEIIGANVGFHHHSDVAARDIVNVISNSFHLSLIKHLVRFKTHFSLLCDSSTNTNDAYLICYIQATEDGLAISHFYSLIHLSEGEKGIAMANAVKAQILRDEAICPGFEMFFRDYLVAIVSDGASSMTGDNNSFKTHLMGYIGRKIPNVICLAHRLDTSIKFSLKLSTNLNGNGRIQNPLASKYFEKFEESSNLFFSFYASRGHKKWLHFQTIAEELNITPKRLQRFIKVRWSASHFNAMQAIDHDYIAMVVDLQRISNGDGGFDKNGRDTAIVLHKKLIDKTYAASVREFLDFLTVFKEVSVQLQASASILVGKVEILYSAIEKIQSLGYTVGNHLSKFLAKCSCPNICAVGKCSLQQYDHCDQIQFDRITLMRTDQNSVVLSEERSSLYANFVTGIRNYFQLDVFSAFQLFDPNFIAFEKFATSAVPNINTLYIFNERAQILGYHTSVEQKIQTICSFYYLSDDECTLFAKEWEVLIRSITKNSFILEHRSSNPIEFWKMTLLQNVGWTQITKKVVQFVSVTSYSSAECERGFSFVNSIKSKERSKMKKETLDALVRIKANGPPVTEFNSYKYAKEFLRAGYARSDDSDFKGGRPCNEANFGNALHRSRIY